MAFEVEEVEERITEVELVSLLYGGKFSLYIDEKNRRSFQDEFWSDPCWSEP